MTIDLCRVSRYDDTTDFIPVCTQDTFEHILQPLIATNELQLAKCLPVLTITQYIKPQFLEEIRRLIGALRESNISNSHTLLVQQLERLYDEVDSTDLEQFELSTG